MVTHQGPTRRQISGIGHPKWQDERARRAISLAFDRNAFDETQGGDNLNPEGAFSFISTPPWPTLFDSYPTAAVQGPWYQYDPEQASQLLQAAGYSTDNPLTCEIVGWYQRTTVPNSESMPRKNKARISIMIATKIAVVTVS